MSNKVSDKLSFQNPNSFSDEVLFQKSNNVSDKVLFQMSNNFSDKVLFQMSNNFSDKVHIFQMSNNVSDKLSFSEFEPNAIFSSGSIFRLISAVPKCASPAYESATTFYGLERNKGVDVMITIFCDFRPMFGEKLAFLHKLAVV
jgi:hypothetical protein